MQSDYLPDRASLLDADQRVLPPALDGRRMHAKAACDLVDGGLAGQHLEDGALPLLHRAPTRPRSDVHLAHGGRLLVALSSGTSHCLCSLTRSRVVFQFLEVSTCRRGTPYGAAPGECSVAAMADEKIWAERVAVSGRVNPRKFVCAA